MVTWKWWVVKIKPLELHCPTLYSPSTITTQSVESEPRLLVAVQRYFPLSLGWQLMISMVMTPSV